MDTWKDRALAYIAAIDAQLPTDMPLKDRERAIQSRASLFHGGTSWGQKVWPKAKRAYLAKYGARTDSQVPAKHLSPLERMMLKAIPSPSQEG